MLLKLNIYSEQPHEFFVKFIRNRIAYNSNKRNHYYNNKNLDKSKIFVGKQVRAFSFELEEVQGFFGAKHTIDRFFAPPKKIKVEITDVESTTKLNIKYIYNIQRCLGMFLFSLLMTVGVLFHKEKYFIISFISFLSLLLIIDVIVFYISSLLNFFFLKDSLDV